MEGYIMGNACGGLFNKRCNWNGIYWDVRVEG